MKCFVTGAFGFVGSHLVDRLLADGHYVIGYDNFITGRMLNVSAWHEIHPKFDLVRGNILDCPATEDAMKGCDIVFHLAANADVRNGLRHPEHDLQINTMGTQMVLEAMRTNNIKRIAFASTGSVYGEPSVFPTPEDAPFPVQTSLYGASKLAAEGLIQAYCEGYGFQSYIFRFVSMLGERYSHGHVIDFYKSLRRDPTQLIVLGDGGQSKSYLYVKDAVDAMLLAVEKAQAKVNIFNVGHDDYITVNESVNWIARYLMAEPMITRGIGERGWIGDSPLIWLNCEKIRALGWQPKVSIKDAIIRTLDYLKEQDIEVSR